MGKLVLAFILLLSCSIAALATPAARHVAEWFHQLPYKTQKVTHLHFYFHDRATGDHPSVVEVARSNITGAFPSQFGVVYVADDPLTEGPDLSSKEIGRAQGISASSDQNQAAYAFGYNFVFTSGDYNGSTLSVFSRNPIWQTTRELAVVGGTGAFRLARGVAVLNTRMINSTTQSVTVEYDIFVVHYG